MKYVVDHLLKNSNSCFKSKSENDSYFKNLTMHFMHELQRELQHDLPQNLRLDNLMLLEMELNDRLKLLLKPLLFIETNSCNDDTFNTMFTLVYLIICNQTNLD